jgi:GNAT superfamily N-acetyltransferase
MKKVSIDKIKDMQNIFYNQCTAPLDDYWVFGVIAAGEVYLFDDGYCIVKGQKLLQFYHKTWSKTLFSAVIKHFNINTLTACTYDHMYYQLCSEFGSNRKVLALFFEDNGQVELDKPFNCSIIKATTTMLQHIMKYTQSSMDESGDHVLNFYKHLIDTDALYLVMEAGQLIGTGEIRPSQLNKGYANLGMTVDVHHRSRGLGRFILNEMKAIAYERNLIPICGTDISNEGSKNAIEACGFQRYQSVFEYSI